MKKGFALIMAMIFIVLVATIGALGLSFASKSVKQAGDVYLKEQAEILALNAVDYVTMVLQMRDRTSSDCLEEVIIYYPSKEADKKLFDIKATIVGYGGRTCKNADNNISSDAVIPQDNELYNAAIVDVVVQGTPNSDPNLRYVYRTTVIP